MKLKSWYVNLFSFNKLFLCVNFDILYIDTIINKKYFSGSCYNTQASLSVGHSIRALTVPREALTRQSDNMASAP